MPTENMAQFEYHENSSAYTVMTAFPWIILNS